MLSTQGCFILLVKFFFGSQMCPLGDISSKTEPSTRLPHLPIGDLMCIAVPVFVILAAQPATTLTMLMSSSQHLQEENQIH